MPTLGADFSDIQSEIGFHLGFGRDITAFSTEDSQSVLAWIKAGLQRFCYGAYQADQKNTYEWSFLKRVFHISTHIDQTEYDLPVNFGSPDGPILWDMNTMAYRPIELVNEAALRARLSVDPTVTGIPLLYSVFSKSQDGSHEQRQAIVLYPRPDTSYRLRLSYNIEPSMLTAEFPWPPGGSPHARTLMYACLAEATKRHDDNESYEAQYQASLLASMNYDARQKGDNLGYNSDPKQRERDGWWGWDDCERFTDLRVLVHGTQY